MSINFTHNKNTVATPWHIAELLTEYFDAGNKRTFDPTAGIGSFLQYTRQPYGIEYDTSAYERLQESLPDGHFVHGSLFEQTDWIKAQNIEVVLMNPPFNQPKELMPKEYSEQFGKKGADSTKGLWWVQFVADTVGSGRLAAIIPTSCGGTGKKAIDQVKAELLKRHTLDAVLSFNNELFYPGASVGTICMIFTLGKPHTGKTLFINCTDDGLIKDRTQGRIDKDNKWADIKQEWLHILQEKIDAPKQTEGHICSAYKEVTDTDSWTPSSHWEYDLTPTDEDFKKTVRDYMDWRISQIGLQAFLDENPHLKPTKEEQKQKIQRQIAVLQARLEQL